MMLLLSIVAISYTYLFGDSARQDVSVTRTALSMFAIVTIPVIASLSSCQASHEGRPRVNYA